MATQSVSALAKLQYEKFPFIDVTAKKIVFIEDKGVVNQEKMYSQASGHEGIKNGSYKMSYV